MAITFKSVLASGGSGAVITVTYSAEFYNQTLTATNGTDTVTALATSAGSVDITVPSAGSWVVSCTISGETYTSETVSVDLSYSTQLVAIPDGSTVMPTDDVQTWLKCAGINDKAYTTLSEVLADSVTFNALLGDSNACAYMARSTTWALASGLVPTMTDATHPSGVVSAKNAYSSNPAYYAFDGNDSTYWAGNDAVSSSNTTTSYIQYQFASATVVKRVEIKNSVYAEYPTNFVSVMVSGSNDDVTYTPLYTDSTERASNSFNASFNNSTAYLYYKVTMTVKNVGSSALRLPHISSLQFYTEADFMTDQYAMSMIGQYDVCCDALLGNATWASAIVNSAYADYVLNGRGLVPVMTSNTAPSGVASASSYNSSGYEAYKAFDGNDSTLWVPSAGAVDNYVAYEFTSPVKAKLAYVLISKWQTQSNDRTFYIRGTNNTSSWTNLGSFVVPSGASSGALMFAVELNNDTDYTYYSLYCAETMHVASTWSIQINTLQFYDLEPSGELIHGTTNESAYYLDNGTEVAIVDPSTLSAGTYTFGSTVAKDPSDLTADYTKSIRITPNTVEVVLRPDCALYWWGYESANLEVVNTANGWSRSGMSLNSPTFNVNNISCTSSSSSNSQNVGLKTSAYGINNLYVIATGVTAYNGNYGYMILNNTKTWSSTSAIKSEYINVITQTKYTFTCEQATANSYLFVGAGWSMACTLHAIWTD